MLSSKRIIRTETSDKASQGSMVLEASLVMPVFIIVMFFFIYMVQMTVYSLQMQIVASNVVKQVSAHIYPVALAVDKYSEQDAASGSDASKQESVFDWSMPKLSLSEWAGQYADSLPEPLSRWILDAAAKGDEPLNDIKNSVLETILDPVVKPLLQPFVQNTLLREERVHVSRITVPDLKTGRIPYFGIELSYELPIKIPFSNRKVVLQARAQERLWIGDTGELRGYGKEEQDEGQAPIILSKPEPAFAGHKARVSAKVEPGTVAKLTVYYKSGVSQAKYLGEASADEHGVVEWQWLVGGNTTPGTWTFVVETGDGLRTTAEFVVASPNKKN
ncbi:pilus assembly protein [Paenibacillus lentus]|uniref:Pilus assembly protein n=1 Tax=Paenibacillus lentus TaxID=1338368 RepID=A0A3Q8S675_9BACL|nr:pilus assembly protein [Paenibacillus lentus]AZK48313.1 pilus assembly protein [Paenibacillus lentus]